MLSKPIQNLIEFFLRFPGVGPKQATRFVFYLLREDRERVRAMAEAIGRLQDDVRLCAQCYKTFDANGSAAGAVLCEFCRGPRRNANLVLVVEKEVDLEGIERTRTYDGLYHVLGGTVHPLDSTAPAKLHLRELFQRVQELAASAPAPFSNSQELERKAAGAARGTVEVILATNPTAEGDATALYLERILTRLKNQYPALKVSRLGRGLTTG